MSFRGGTITYNDQTLQSPLPIIILALGGERSYYARPFNPDVAATPDCYSFDGERPHPAGRQDAAE